MDETIIFIKKKKNLKQTVMKFISQYFYFAILFLATWSRINSAENHYVEGNLNHGWDHLYTMIIIKTLQ